MTGFRITALLQGFSGSVANKKKCLVFIDDRWTKVADLEEHMKEIFHAKRVELFIDDCWVSSEEPICIIKPSDIITVKEVEFFKEPSPSATRHSCEEVEPEKKEKRSKKKKVEHSPITTADKPTKEPEVDDAALAAKKLELLMKVDAVLDHEEMDVTDDALQPAIKRRRRKRPSKKRKEFLEGLSVGSTLLSCMAQSVDTGHHTAPPSEELYSRPTSSNHIRFDEESVLGNSESTKVEIDCPKEDWQERLLALTQERKKPTFVRNEIVSGRISDSSVRQNGVGVSNGLNGCAKVNGEHEHGKRTNGCFDDGMEACSSAYIHNSVPTETPKANDILCFKRLACFDGMPQVSDYLLALVEEVDDRGTVILKVLEGDVARTFTPDEIQDSEDGYFIVKTEWIHILQPRLIVDSSVLSKYL